jgi:DNA-binding MarR family transcriptional regulator
MEPTTLSAIQNMERSGLVRRVRSKTDQRKWHVRLTRKGRDLRRDLIPLARDVVGVSVKTLSAGEVRQLLYALQEIQKNIEAATNQLDVNILTASNG